MVIKIDRNIRTIFTIWLIQFHEADPFVIAQIIGRVHHFTAARSES